MAFFGRRNRGSEESAQVEEGIAVTDLVYRHLLLVPTTTDPELVGSLVQDRHPSSDLHTAGELLLGRHCRLTGPYALSLEDAVEAGVPMPWTVCYCLEAPVEREAPPLPGVDDRDGFAFAFPDGLPWRDEGRALHMLVSIARRIGGAVRCAGSLELIQPDPQRAVDHVVHAPDWLEPGVLLGLVQRDLPGAVLAIDSEDWNGPSDEAYSGAIIEHETRETPLTAAQLEYVHAYADSFDMAVLSQPPVIDAFAIVADMGHDGTIEVLTHLSDGDEPAVWREPWAAGEFYTYEVRWINPDPAQREQRVPSEAFRVARSRVAPLIATVTRSIVEATHGVVLDEDGFRVDRYLL
ncbi:hypothetical protein ACIB24_02415 [Spongisporangium articulatum]|uniref:Uncharacterized protein n=1 Tax=Spongisporangium articulatum TaxID=3362603 RepID=A0ABW8AHR9_9ACTN